MKLSLDNLGFTDLNLQRLKRILRLPYGMILVTGPTGSGKTTTLYSALNYINSAEVNIITIEDPIEYQLPGINQTQVKPEIGLTFATILRTSLRQDPNIIMIGEIRDRETAEIAIRSAQTGHLVLSTLHTNNALGTVIRLLDMGIEPFLIANSLKLVISQRLVRRICPECKTRENINLKRIKLPIPESDLFKNEFYRGNGCQHCGHTGYTGRIAIDEQIEIDNDFSELILQKASLRTMQEEASHKGIEPLHVTAMGKALQGITSLNEVVAETVH
jgi:type IV pilus assembly protein PilB